MASRLRVRKRKDKKVFTHSAVKTKDINIKPLTARGGVRL